MEMENGKLFIGGISWDTNEERLKEYFQTFGEVIEAVIMKDRNTGRARGFGFVVFLDPAVAERVVKEKHMIDGRTVEAKKAVPRDDQQIHNTNTRTSGSSIHGSPGPTRTKKIFVGGLASSVTETDFKNYFDQFGIITDVVVMYDHNTQRPRGFGFITYDSEESVDKALLKTFHELNGKMVEVKRAVPKESSPGPNKNLISGFGLNHGFSRANSFLNYGFGQGYNSPSYGRFSPVSVGRTGYPPFSPSSYNLGLNSDSVFSMNYGRAVSPMYDIASNRFADPIGYGIGGSSGGGGGYGGGGGGYGGGNGSVLESSNHSMWGNGIGIGNGNGKQHLSMNVGNHLASRNGSDGLGAIWGGSIGGQGGGNDGFSGGNLNYGIEESGVGYRRNSGNGIDHLGYSYGVTDDGDNMFLGGDGGGGGGAGGGRGGGLLFGESTLRASSPDLEVSELFGYNLGSGASDGLPKNSVGYVGYSVTNRSNRGIAA